MGGRDRKDKKKKKKKGKKGNKKIPWYLQEEMMKAKEEKARQEREAEEAKIRLEEEERRWAALTPAEREKEEVVRAAEAKRAQWQQFEEKQAAEEERWRRIEEERALVAERRQKERELRQKQLAEGKDLEYSGNLVIQKCKHCHQKCYKHEQIAVGNDVFHKIGCFKCIFCSQPLKLWNYKILQGRYYCTPHYEQFHVKIINRIQHEIKMKALLIEQLKDEERRLEEEKRIREEQAAKEQSDEQNKLKAIREEELRLKRIELAVQAEEMRRMIEAQEKGIEYVPLTGSGGKDGSDSDSDDDSGSDSDSDSDDDSEEEEEKIDPEVEALVKAAREGVEETLTSLLTKGISIDSENSEGHTSLMAAALASRQNIVELLINRGAEVSKKGKRSQSTALHLVCNSDPKKDKTDEKTESEIVRILAEHPKTEINDTDMNLNTPLILASSKGKVEVVRTLVKAKAKVGPRNNLGATCLHAAADSGQVEVAKQLMNVEQLDFDQQDEQGYTPLHLAVMGNHVAMTRLLLALGANIHIGEKAHNRSPLAEAQIRSAEMKKLFDLFAHKKDASPSSPGSLKLDISATDNRDKSPKKSRFGRLFTGTKGKDEKPGSGSKSPRRRESSNDEQTPSGGAFPGIPLRQTMPSTSPGPSSPQPLKRIIPSDQTDGTKKSDEDLTKKRDDEERKRKEKEERKKEKEERKKKKEEDRVEAEKRAEEQRKQDEIRKAEIERRVEEERKIEEEQRKEEERKKKEEERKKAQQVMGAIKTRDAPAFLTAPEDDKKETVKPVLVGKIKPPAFTTATEPDVALSPRSRSQPSPKKIQTPSFLSEEKKDTPEPREPRTVGKVKPPAYLTALEEAGTEDKKDQPGRAVGKIKTPAFLAGTEEKSDQPLSSSPARAVGKIKPPAFLTNSGEETLSSPRPGPPGGPGKLKKPAFLEAAEQNTAPKKKGSHMGGRAAPGKIKRPAFLEKAEQEAREEEEEEEEEEDEDVEYEYEYVYEEEE